MFFDNVYLINANNFMEVKNLPHLEEARYDFGEVCIKSKQCSRHTKVQASALQTFADVFKC